MTTLLKIPTLEEAERLMHEAECKNPGPWVQHSVNVAQAARLIAAQHPTLDADSAYTLGLLHDIGRREGVTDLRHVLDGYTFLKDAGFEDAAQICLTHSFPIQDIRVGSGQWDCSPVEYAFIEGYLASISYTDYDRLIQLCDSLALPSGFCLMEKRLVDVALRRGINDYTVDKWKAFLSIQQAFEQAIGQSIYALLPGVVGGTFGFKPA